MSHTIIDLSHRFAMLREQNEAWKLLNAKRSPLILACAEQLFSGKEKAVTLEEAVEILANIFNTFSNDSLMDINE
ncbi:MAG: DUF3375 family protein, partial [Moraxellaceae bacterium]|nr:DUF3375 family protein [Moraxellaceae bacterium]